MKKKILLITLAVALLFCLTGCRESEIVSYNVSKEADSFADYTDWYVSANTGMGACLVMAEEMGGYILTDKATFLTFYTNDGVIG